MSLDNNKTGQLWGSFGPYIIGIKDRINSEKISMQVYPSDYYKNFDPSKKFDKWATVEVSTFSEVPKDLETFILEGGEYAVFDYKGLAAKSSDFFHYIFNSWFPKSAYIVDSRPHFEVLGDKYKNNNPNSEEEIWIPIRKK